MLKLKSSKPKIGKNSIKKNKITKKKSKNIKRSLKKIKKPKFKQIVDDINLLSENNIFD